MGCHHAGPCPTNKCSTCEYCSAYIEGWNHATSMWRNRIVDLLTKMQCKEHEVEV